MNVCSPKPRWTCCTHCLCSTETRGFPMREQVEHSTTDSRPMVVKTRSNFTEESVAFCATRICPFALNTIRQFDFRIRQKLLETIAFRFARLETGRCTLKRESKPTELKATQRTVECWSICCQLKPPLWKILRHIHFRAGSGLSLDNLVDVERGANNYVLAAKWGFQPLNHHKQKCSQCFPTTTESEIRPSDRIPSDRTLGNRKPMRIPRWG